MKKDDPLFAPLELGPHTLRNRIVMGPLTRSRSRQPGNVPWELNAEYYRQRASAGLILSEATHVAPEGQGFPAMPGIHSGAQVQGWRKVTEAVHGSGGLIYAQLWHAGRISHQEVHHGWPVAPSAIRPDTWTYVPGPEGWRKEAVPLPRELSRREIARLVRAYRSAAENALRAGFDGVQIHAAFGYLLDQFLRDGSNRRKDEYGGTLAGRLRFPLEVVDAVTAVWGPDRIGARISPLKHSNDALDSDPQTTFGAFVNELSIRSLSFLEVVEAGPRDGAANRFLSDLRERFTGAYLANGDLDADGARRRLIDGSADAVSFGRAFIANPDLPARLSANVPLNAPDRQTFYGGGARGYIDYPASSVSPNVGAKALALP